MASFALVTLGAEPHSHQAIDDLVRLATLDRVGAHHISSDLDSADHIVFVDFAQHLNDPFLRRLGDHPALRRYPERCLVIDYRDRPIFTLPGIYVSGSRRQARWRPICGGPYPTGFRIASEPAVPDGEADLLYSFRGSATHQIRHKLAEGKHDRAHVSLVPTSRTVSSESRSNDDDGYMALMRRSKFVLCPRGHGKSSFRIFEALSIGRVPVIISDNWLAPPGPSWTECSIRVSERRIGDIPHLLRTSEDRYEALSASARGAWSKYFADDVRWNTLAAALGRMSRRTQRVMRPPKPLQMSIARAHLGHLRAEIRRSC